MQLTSDWELPVSKAGPELNTDDDREYSAEVASYQLIGPLAA